MYGKCVRLIRGKEINSVYFEAYVADILETVVAYFGNGWS